MRPPQLALTAVLILILGVVGWLALGGSSPDQPGELPHVTGPGGDPGAMQAAAAAADAGAAVGGGSSERVEEVDPMRARTGLRGRVVDVRTGRGLPGVDIRALRQPPSLERLVSRFRGLFRGGLWNSTARDPEVLGTAVSGPDGSFEILGVPAGQLFVDGRSEAAFVRTPAAVRLAAGEIRDGVELLAAPGGRIRGVVRGAEGQPLASASVSVRPGLNAFLGQITQRKYRWLEAKTDADGRYEVYGVPSGAGYVVSASHSDTALEEVYGIDVEEGRTRTVDIRGHAGAEVLGRVVDDSGAPLAGATVAMVYLDVSRILFSADGRDEPVRSDADGNFRFGRVAAGRVAFVAASEGVVPSQIEERTVVDGGIYDDLVLRVGDAGAVLTGRVVDEQDQPLRGARVTVRPMERPNDPDMLKLALKIRKLDAETDAEGRFTVAGLDGDRAMVQAEKAGYCTEIRFSVKFDEPDLVLKLVRGATVRGVVVDSEGRPIPRFRFDTRTEQVDFAKLEASGGNVEEATVRRSRRRGPPWMRRGSRRVPAGTKLGDRGFGGSWRDASHADGKFTLGGLPPGKIRVRVEAEGYLRGQHEVLVKAGESSEELRFELAAGVIARGRVVDARGVPVPDAQVSASRSRRRGGRGPIPFNFERADFDFLALMTRNGRNGALTDSKGQFVLRGLEAGKYRFSARHPELAKASVKDVEVDADAPPQDIVIELAGGGAVEGTVTGAGRQPLRDALVVAASLSAGAFKSSTTNERGYYKVEGLPPGQYIVFKSRMDERSSNLGFDLLGNMRLKTVRVRDGKTAKLDIYDAAEGTVRVFGRVIDAGQPVPRAMVTVLTSDTDGILGMGVRAKPTDAQGNYELVGLKPGDYVFQVTRFRGRPEQAGLSVEVPDGVTDHRVDLEIPQSYIAGKVVDVEGQPLAGIRVSAGVTSGGTSQSGLLGLIMKNGASQARTDSDGNFKLKSLAEGTYRVTASGARRRGRGRGRAQRGAETGTAAVRYGETAIEGLRIDGRLPIDDVVLTLPRAGALSGIVVDGSGSPVSGADITYSREDVVERQSRGDLADLFGVQRRRIRTGADGRFRIEGVTPGTYRVSGEIEDKAPGIQDNVVVVSDAEATVQLTVVRGATIKARVRNIDGTNLPLANLSLLDGKGKPIVRSMSTVSIFRRLMGSQKKKDSSGWRTFGDVPPDTYTLVIQRKDEPEIRVTRTVRDGETLEWDVDMAAELEAIKK